MTGRTSYLCLGVLGLIVGLTVEVCGQTNPQQSPPLRKARGPLAPALKLGDRNFVTDQPQGRSLPALDFSIKGIRADQILSEAEQRTLQSRLFARMNTLQRLVDMIVPDDPHLQDTTPLINQLNQKRLEAAPGSELRHDLDNLLISTLVTARGEAVDSMTSQSSGELLTRIWSYRRLERTSPEGYVENWGPTIVVHPNDVLFIPVLNLLYKRELEAKSVPGLAIPDGVPTGSAADSFDNAPHDFDVTNLHTHGLNVSPDWPSDDIFRSIRPGRLKFFVYHIPADHPTGTYFYHPHYHGSVATQVAGGMAGPLLVVSNPGDLRGLDQAGVDLGWTDADTTSASLTYPHTLLIQQLSLFRNGSQPVLFTRPDFFAMKDMGPWTGDVENQRIWVTKSDRAPIRRLATILQGLDPHYPIKTFAVSTWINGRYQPVLGAIGRGEIRRLRVIHAGVEAKVDLKVQYKVGDAFRDLEYQVIARDGIPLPVPQKVPGEATSFPIEGDVGRLTLAPGNRADVLIALPQDTSTFQELELASENSEGRVLLARVPVAGNAPQMATGFLTQARAAAVQQERVNGRLVNCPEMPSAIGIDVPFNLSFADAVSADPGTSEVSVFSGGTFKVNNEAFPGDQHVFQLSTTSSLRLEIADGSGEHPFHIHVNPFLVPAAADEMTRIYRDLRGLPKSSFWSDTLLVEEGHPFSVQMPFNNWTGRYVGHCHILDHEDAGMMSKLRIDPSTVGVPKLPFPELISLPSIPRRALAALRQESPHPGGVIPNTVPDTVTIIAFMPKLPTGACPHCTAAVRAISQLHDKGSPTKLRIIAITNGSGKDLPDRTALNLGPSDLLCSDTCLCAFEACGLIDGTPVVSDNEGYCVPSAFKSATRTLRDESDLMHGLFVVSPDGKVYSERRGFEAFDESIQIMAEVVAAGLPIEQRNTHLKSLLQNSKQGVLRRVLEQRLERAK